MPAGMDFVSQAEKSLRAHGFEYFGFAPLNRPATFDAYREWLDQGLHAGMTYLERHAPNKENPRSWRPRARSAIVVTVDYARTSQPPPFDGLRTALYARGRDYHLWFKEKLEAVAADLGVLYASDEFLCFTDSAPILERDLARLAGLGFIGKNNCLIHPKRGSLFFIGEILTSVTVTGEHAPLPDHCGTCDRCIKACPTQALDEHRLDANRCIAYWTIEAKEAAPEALRPAFGDWFFGCDVCQTVCPWNEKAHGRAWLTELADATPDTEELRGILRASNRELRRRTEGTALARAKPLGLKRNALIVIANRRLRELKPEVEQAVLTEELKEVAVWTLAQLA